MKLGTILGVSIGVNVILLAVSLSSGSAPRPDTTSHSNSNTKAALPNSTRTSKATSPTAVPLQWRNLRSDDLHIYTSNLRAAGFPEALVHKIIIAELDRQIAAEKRSAADTNYWKTGFQRDEAQRKAQEEKRTFAEQRRQRIHDLLGPLVHQASAYGDDLWMLVTLTGVSDLATLDRLSGVWPKLMGAGSPERSDPAVHRQMHDETMAELREILGPSRFEEFELRSIALDVMDVWGAERLFGCMMTGAEFRELLRLRKEITPSSSRARGLKLQIPDAPPELTQKIDEQIRVLLGEERFNGYLRAKSGGFKGIHSVFRNEETMDLSWAVYDIYAALKDAATRIADQPGLDEAERKAALLTLRAKTEQALQTKMGPEKFANYFLKDRRNFHWLDELTVKDQP